MNKVEQYIESQYEAALAQMGYELVDVVYEKNAGIFFLRLFIDCLEEGKRVDLNACEEVNRYLSDALDADDGLPIQQAYQLEVSSPGIERPLKKSSHFKRFIGEDIRINLYKAIEGQKKCKGVLEAADEEGITFLRADGLRLHLRYDDIAKANLHFEF